MLLTAPLPLLAGLRDHGPAAALITDTATISYADLADRIEAARAGYGEGRRLVAVAMRNDIDSVVRYLAALAAGHAVVAASPCRLDEVLAGVGAGTVLRSGEDGAVRIGDPGRDLHPDLALLLSTSGSTGSPKLVRLSYANLQSNAESIAQYLAIRRTDVAITTLPLHYCYGLSVLHSHLLAGAALRLTGMTVTDPGFARTMAGVTTLPGVPHTFDLLDAAGFVPPATLRTATVAGGRMDPDRVADWARHGQAHGFDFFVMYGQTEATARMLYLPPDLALAHPGAAGIPIPGGSATIEDGELVYRGPNVMMGYAQAPPDLALPPGPAVLRTGDLARINAAGLIEITGRRSRFAKLFGQRVDLAGVEASLAGDGLPVWCAEAAGCLVAACLDSPDAVRPRLCRATGLPPSAVVVRRVADVPRTESGKPDYRAVAGLADAGDDPAAQPETVAQLLAVVLRLPPGSVGPGDTFVGLGGDSLSYVAAAAAIERRLGSLPVDWHVTPVGQLQPAPRGRGRLRRMDTTVLLRALAIVAIVASHVGVIDVRGGAHLLLVIAGWNFARFRTGTGLGPVPEARAALLSVARFAVPAAVYLAFVALLSGEYGRSLLFGINLFGPVDRAPEWRYWYVEALVAVLLAAIAALALGHRLQRRRPYGFALAAVGAGLVLRWTMVAEDGPSELYTPVAVAWLFAVGWALAAAGSPLRRALVLGLLVAGMAGYFDDPWRAAVVVGGTVLVAVLPSVAVPALLVPVVSAVAGASLWIYLTHWQVYPPLESFGWAAVAASVLVGIAGCRIDVAAQALLVRRGSSRASAEPAARVGA